MDEPKVPRPPKPAQRDVRWIEGLRGLTSLLIVSSHLFRSFAIFIVSPALSDNGPVHFFQHPFLRLPAQSAVWVALFFLLSGLVNALGFIRAIHIGNFDYAHVNLARSTFRRIGRLVLPCAAATILSWMICHLNGYELARQHCDGWIHETLPDKSPSFFAAISTLFSNIIATWTFDTNYYDKNQWTMPFFLQGSLLVTLTMVGTFYSKARYWPALVLSLYAYCWVRKDALMGMNIFAGILIAKVCVIFPAGKLHTTLPRIILPMIPIVLGLYLTSYPEHDPDWSPWSQSLHHWGLRIFPNDSDTWRFWSAIGTHILVVGIAFSKHTQTVLGHPILTWLGEISYAVYLLHGPLIRSFLVWMLFGLRVKPPASMPDESGPVRTVLEPPGKFHMACALAVFFAVLVLVSKVWTLYIESWCAKATGWVEEKAFLSKQEVMDYPKV